MRTKLVIGLLCAGLLVGATVPALANHNGNSQDNNVPICHKGRTIHVNSHAVPAHLRHGDVEGHCAAAAPTGTPTAPSEATPTDTPEPAATPTNTVEATPTDTVEPTPDGTPAGTSGLRLHGKSVRFSFW